MKKILLLSIFLVVGIFLFLSIHQSCLAVSCGGTTCTGGTSTCQCNASSCATKGDYCTGSPSHCANGWAGGSSCSQYSCSPYCACSAGTVRHDSSCVTCYDISGCTYGVTWVGCAPLCNSAPPPPTPTTAQTPNCNTNIDCSSAYCSASCGSGSLIGCVFRGPQPCNVVSASGQTCQGINCPHTCQAGCSSTSSSCYPVSTNAGCGSIGANCICQACPCTPDYSCPANMCDFKNIGCNQGTQWCGLGCPPPKYSCIGTTCSLGGSNFIEPTCGGSCVIHIVSGYVYEDLDNSGGFTPGEGYNGAKIDQSVSDGTTAYAYTTSYGGVQGLQDGAYLSAIKQNAGTIIQETLEPIPGYTIVSANPVPINDPNKDWRIDWKISRIPTFNVSGNVFIDTNGDKKQDCVNPLKLDYPTCSGSSPEQAYKLGTTISLSSGISVPTDGNGNYILKNLAAGSYSVIFTPPAGYVLTTNPIPPVVVGPNQILNIGIILTPTTYSITGNVYLDDNKNGIKDGAEVNYPGGIDNEITMSPMPSGAVITFNSSAGTYKIDNVPSGTNYQISYIMSTALTQGYTPTSPNGSPPMYTVDVGPCKVGGSPAIPPCVASGDINPLNFGITNSIPWIQSVGGDFYQNGFSDPIPATATNAVPYGPVGGPSLPFASVFGVGGQTPGIIYTGNTNPNFGLTGSASQKPPAGWIVGGQPYSETYTSNGALLNTSYGRVSALINEYGIPVKDITNACGVGGVLSCDLSAAATGIYTSNKDVFLNASTIQGSNPNHKNIVILIDGNLTIKGKVLVNNGSTLLITVSKDITVSPSVGEASPSTYCTVPQSIDNGSSLGCSIEGYYSADKNFIIKGSGGSSCPAGDLRLNVGGSVVANASNTGGSFNYNGINGRDLCGGGSTFPVVSITERPDFILNAPEFFKTQRRVWQEIAP